MPVSFVVCAGLIALMGRYPMPKPDDEASVAVIVANLRSGMGTLFGTPDPALPVPGRRVHVLLVRPVERPAAAVLDP